MEEYMKRITTLLVIGLLAQASLFSGGERQTNPSQSTAPVGEKPGVSDSGSVITEKVSVGVNADIADIAPWSSVTAGRNSVLPSFYEYLGYLDPQKGLVGMLMQSCEPQGNAVYKVKIYDYIYDSAGNHITAKDVEFSLMTWKENKKSVKCAALKHCNAIDDYTVEIALNTDTVGDFETIICGLAPIVSQKAYESSPDKMISAPISTARYKVKEYVSGSHITLVKRDDYWQKDPSLIPSIAGANAKEISFHVITEVSQMAINLEAKSIDIAPAIDPKEAERFISGGSSKAGYKVFEENDTQINLIIFNCDPSNVFSNKALRQAVCYAIDAKGLIQGVASGKATVAKAIGNPICVDYNPQWDNEPYYDYDIDKARELLKESKVDVSGLNIKIMSPSQAVYRKAAEIIQAYLAQIGIKSTINSYDQALFQQYRNDPSQYDITVDARLNYDYVVGLASMFDSRGYQNGTFNFVRDQKLQSFVEKVTTVSGHTKEAVDEYMHYLKDQAFMYPYMILRNYYVTVDSVSEIYLNFKGLLMPGPCVYTKTNLR
jgi:ABC-type transport system substrate-binding protein